MKTIAEIYQQEGAPFLNYLHQKTGANRKYIYHLAVGLRRPSPEMALRLCQADNRLGFTRLLLPDLLGDELDEASLARPCAGEAGAVDGGGGAKQKQKKRGRDKRSEGARETREARDKQEKEMSDETK